MSAFSLRALVPSLLMVVWVGLSNTAAAETEADDAPQDWYQIEAILFEHRNSDIEVLRFEHPQRYMPPKRSEYLFYYTQGEALSPNQVTPVVDEQRLLLNAYNRLTLDPLTRPIAYYAWQHPLERDRELAPLRIFEGPVTGAHAMFEGELQIRRSRYTHAEIDVYKRDFETLPYRSLVQWLTETDEDRWPLSWLALPLAVEHGALNAKGFTQLPQNSLHFAQSRRIKDGEVHYVDHPAMGMIVTIQSIPAPDAELLEAEEYDANLAANAAFGQTLGEPR